MRSLIRCVYTEGRSLLVKCFRPFLSARNATSLVGKTLYIQCTVIHDVCKRS